MAAELRYCLSTLTAGVGKRPVFPTLHGRITGSLGGLSTEFDRLMSRAEVIAPMAAKRKGVPTGAHEEFS